MTSWIETVHREERRGLFLPRSPGGLFRELARGKAVPEVVRKLGVTEQTHYRWKREYGGLRTGRAKRLKDLEKENARLKRLSADVGLDKAILREAASGCRRRAQLNF